jgi:hypothetical protein
VSKHLPAFEAKPVPPEAPVTSFGEVIDPKAALRNCEVGKSFVVDTDAQRQRMIGFAKRLGISIKTKRTLDGRFDIWRTE